MLPFILTLFAAARSGPARARQSCAVALFALVMATGAFLPNPAQAFFFAPLPEISGQDDLPLVLIQSTGGEGSGGCESQSCGDYSKSDPPPPPPPPGVPADAVGITPAGTQAVIALIDEANRYCRDHYERTYWIDCIARAYVRIGKTLPYRGGYNSMRNALLDAGTRLHDLAIANTDKTKPPKTGRTSARSPNELLRAVVQTPKVVKASADIIEGTQLVLLRSASGSDQRRAAYSQVANVVGSTVVLLRSTRRKKRKERQVRVVAVLRALLGRRPAPA